MSASTDPAPPRRAGRALARVARTGVVGVLAAGSAAFVVASVIVPFTTADGDAAKHQVDAVSLHPRSSPASGAVPSTAPSGVTGLPAPLSDTRNPGGGTADPTAVSELAANGVPRTALNAYRVAAARLDNADPSCRLQWPLLAGIGRVESDHGQAGGATLHADGRSTPKIIGPALTGHGNRYVPAPANGVALDGDAKYAHALGPMQFLPSTWAVYGTDADNDGTADIFDIDDAALAAGRYLCAVGGDLQLHTDRVRAVFAYNNLKSYVAEVLGLARAYRTGVTVTGVPVGQLTGTLPQLGQAPAAGLTPAQRAHRRALAQQRVRELARERAQKRTEQRPMTLQPDPSSTAPKSLRSGSASSKPSSHPTKHKPTPRPSSSPSPSPTSILGVPLP